MSHNSPTVPFSGKPLNELVPLTLRRGQPYSEGQSELYQRLAILNFGATGAYALDGVLPVFIAPLLEQAQSAFAEKFKFNLDALVNVGEDTEAIDGLDLGVVTWKRFFSTIPDKPSDYSDTGPAKESPSGKYNPDKTIGVPLDFFARESMNIYKSLMGFEFDINNPANINGDKSIVVFGTAVGGADTNTRETFIKQLGDLDVAAFTTTTIDHVPGQQITNQYNYVDNRFDNQDPSLIALDPNAESWKRLINVEFKSTVHEQGHTLGLAHPNPYNGGLRGSGWEIWQDDSWDFATMSYVSQPEAYEVFRNTEGYFLLNLTPRTLDLLALDQVYGQQQDSKGNTFGTHRAFLGDTIYGFDTNITEDQSIVYANLDKLYDYRIATTIADGGGIDTINARGFKHGSTIDLYVMTGEETAPRLSSLNGTIGNLSFAVNTVIENAIGSEQKDTFYDNQYNNRLEGGGGDDVFHISGGIDTIIGGTGVDTAIIQGNERDFIIQRTSESTAVISNRFNPSFQVFLDSVENIQFANTTSPGDISNSIGIEPSPFAAQVNSPSSIFG